MDFIVEINKKIITNREELKLKIKKLKEKGKKIVFTNGCFDILHTGHIHYLARAKQLGDILIVAVNSDESVQRLKGKQRPVNKLEDRMFILASLFFIDFVTYFNENTPVEIIKIIQPDIHVKGGDYKIDNLPEKSIVETYGGKIIILPFVEGYSTTNILEKLKN